VSLRARLLARSVSPPPALFASLLPDICKPQQIQGQLFAQKEIFGGEASWGAETEAKVVYDIA
jgi:hypothetical protein